MIAIFAQRIAKIIVQIIAHKISEIFFVPFAANRISERFPQRFFADNLCDFLLTFLVQKISAII